MALCCDEMTLIGNVLIVLDGILAIAVAEMDIRRLK